MRAVLIALLLAGCAGTTQRHSVVPHGGRPTLYPYLAYCFHPQLCADLTGRRAT